MADRIGDRLATHAAERFAGRQGELAVLCQLLEESGPLVAHIHGVGGIGKSRLLDAFTKRARSRGASVVRLDCRSIEPTPAGFLSAVAEAAGAPGQDLQSIIERLGEIGGPVVLAMDTYELFLALDAWLRQQFIPELDQSARVIMASREPPVAQWLTAPEWRGGFRSIQLGPLTEHEALTLLTNLGVSREAGRRINAVVRGHPLALTMAATLQSGRLDRQIEDLATQSLDEVARQYLASVDEPATREVLEASSVVRRTTEPMIGAMLPAALPRDAMDRLRSLPFVEGGSDGLIVHDAVRNAIATMLRASDPGRHHAYRVAAWRHLRKELEGVHAGTDLWRWTADLLYLLENPHVRESFFPSGYEPLAIEPATPDDEPAFHSIVERHEGPEGARALVAWWDFHPRSARMVRGREGETAGFSIVLPGAELGREVAARDPIAAAWLEDMTTDREPARAILFRRWLDIDMGEAPSGTYGVANLDLKRAYMEMRPHLRYVYACAREFDMDALRRLRFVVPGELARDLDGYTYTTALLDMGAGSVEGWLTNVIATELGVGAVRDPDRVVDAEAHELILGNRRISLTALEAGLAAHLITRPGKAVSRLELVDRVWGYQSEATSNVVDSVVRGLRRKLGDDARLLETVRGVGYRYQPDS